MASWNSVVERFSPLDPETRDVVARAKHHRAVELARTGRANDSYGELRRIADELGEDKDDPVRVVVGRALATQAAVEIELGRPEDAIRTSVNLGRDFAMFEGERFAWEAACLEAWARFAMGDCENGGRGLRTACRTFSPDGESVRKLAVLAYESVAAGFPIQELIDVLISNVKDAGLDPLLVALRQKAGEHVRAPEEVLAVAADVRGSWDDTGAT